MPHSPTARSDDPVLRVVDLRVEVQTPRGRYEVVRGTSFEVRAGETLGVVGESGAGKSLTAWAVLGLLPSNARISAGEIWLRGERIDRAGEDRLRQIRGNDIGTILQDPTAALNPCMRVGAQVAEPMVLHRKHGSHHVGDRVTELLTLVGIREAAERRADYPHQFSGGMQQRVVGAAAIACDPLLLIADEPTTALDVTVQAEYLKVLKDMQQRTGAAMLFISHDLGVVSEVSDHVAVMYAGHVVETAETAELFRAPRHPYTVGLLNCLPTRDLSADLLPIPGQPPDPANLPAGCSFAPRCSLATDRCREREPDLTVEVADHLARCIHQAAAVGLTRAGGDGGVHDAARPEPPAENSEPLISLESVGRTFGAARLFRKGRPTVAVSDFNLELMAGSSVGLVGETGSGKTTCVRMVLGLDQPTTGSVRYRGNDIARLSRKERHDYRRNVQAVLQNPFSSFNPRISLGRSVAEPLLELSDGLSSAERKQRVAEALGMVGLSAARVVNAYPHTLSGGQLQRVAIARAMITRPMFLVLDEPVSALDVSIKIQVLNLLKKIRAESGVGVLMVSHDLGAVQQLCQNVVVLLRGNVVERGPVEQIFTDPQHEYTRRLVADALIGASTDRTVA